MVPREHRLEACATGRGKAARGVVRGEHRLEACATGRGRAAQGVTRGDGTYGTDRGGLRITRHASRVTRQEEGECVWAGAQGAGTRELRLSVASGGLGVVGGEHRLEACGTGKGKAAAGAVRGDGTNGTDGTGGSPITRHASGGRGRPVRRVGGHGAWGGPGGWDEWDGGGSDHASRVRKKGRRCGPRGARGAGSAPSGTDGKRRKWGERAGVPFFFLNSFSTVLSKKSRGRKDL